MLKLKQLQPPREKEIKAMQFSSGCPFDLSFVNFLNIKSQI